MQTIKLKDYSIFVGDDWNVFEHFLQNNSYSRLAVIVDENTKNHCRPILEPYLSGYNYFIIEIPSGEKHKTIQTCQFIWQRMMDENLDRNALVINLGGGVIGDMGGFCASTYKRGIHFIQIPTTLLSQVDASIGGKLGIDFHEVKNSIGLFQNPQSVFIFPEFLKTLPKREIRSGFAEIIKHSLIADVEQWEKLQTLEKLDSINWSELIPPSLLIKKRIVEEDPFERGLRKALNFGHTIGHAVESQALSTENPLLHGEAVAIGMICEAYISCETDGLPASSLEAISDYILKMYGHRAFSLDYFPSLMRLMAKDKKNENQTINFTTIHPIGNALINRSAPEELIRKSLEYYLSLQEKQPIKAENI
ncbi:MAG: 3-dehydroquinate synthase [Bacteroidetes bacterium]|nr:3-dehydroquinate synthase [Bacteroidota bacterium]